jgi:hypothetical protein
MAISRRERSDYFHQFLVGLAYEAPMIAQSATDYAKKWNILHASSR